MTTADRLNESGVGPMLNAAAADNSPEAFKNLLKVLFLYLGVEAPKGVFTPKIKAGRPGRPVSKGSGPIYSIWINLGKPSLYKNNLARAFYGTEFTKTSGVDRRKLRDTCRRAVERHVERHLAHEIDEMQKELSDVRKHTARLREQLAQAQEQLERFRSDGK
jgi:hypothetical protein